MSIPIATRVRDLNARFERIGMVIGRLEPGIGSTALLPVTVEGSTRNELWALHRLEPLPRDRQLTGLGGKVAPPKGYPLIPPEERPS
ncbi:MAG: hypothetical protein VKI63_01470 [Cyanobium sp.]|nr:hypothetical protein [Cyanobium sp.]